LAYHRGNGTRHPVFSDKVQGKGKDQPHHKDQQ